MSASQSTENKSLRPAGVEDKAVLAAPPLMPTETLDKPKRGEGVDFVIAIHLSPGNIDDQDHIPGDTVKVTEDDARRLTEAGVGRVKD